ncbi:MAG: hypothetical protein AAB664_04540, partial [Patescibacteria group bacterium]
KCLKLMRQKSGSVSPIQIAYLSDRVNVNLKRPQYYGTQFYFNKKKQLLVPRPIANKKLLDTKRKKIGLESFTIYQKRLQDKNRKLKKNSI